METTQNQLINGGNGYFQNRIKIYIQQYHPDLFQDIELEEKSLALSESTSEQVLVFEKEGYQSTEAIERALVLTLENISSPYGVLLDFINENEETILQLTGNADITDKDGLLRLLPLVQRELETIEYSESPSEVSDAKARLLRNISITLLQRN
ncbi:hypothetical protein Dfri01_59380 [Dyadobacter frigoris]|uniref:hypothetical protein n=1 Tax=Dyadobacter frigoris TaxID=2576211 RepID=UPI0024A234B3|nr:hypothetical protein [Dyadobacter frigoris]GLU56477.1 hypothetical protein Dfri01_59380 [Dyadobacter frigoris]